jgi:hypothetical protein
VKLLFRDIYSSSGSVLFPGLAHVKRASAYSLFQGKGWSVWKMLFPEKWHLIAGRNSSMFQKEMLGSTFFSEDGENMFSILIEFNYGKRNYCFR